MEPSAASGHSGSNPSSSGWQANRRTASRENGPMLNTGTASSSTSQRMAHPSHERRSASKPCNSGASTGCNCGWTRIAAAMAESTLPRNQIRGCSLVTISVPFRWVCASVFSTLAKGRSSVANGCTALPSSRATRPSPDTMRIRIFLLFTSSCAEGVRRSSGERCSSTPCPKPQRAIKSCSVKYCISFPCVTENPALSPKAGYAHCLFPIPQKRPARQSTCHTLRMPRPQP